ncbi:MAG: fluoride efflux transporter CrcB [Bacteroidota bacterium]
MYIVLAVFVGGGFGSLARYGVSRLVTGNFENINPLATLISNTISTILLGVVLYLLAGRIEMQPSWRAFIIIGFCGGFSTFSTFSYEILELFKTANYWYAAGNILISMILGVGTLYVLSRIVQ